MASQLLPWCKLVDDLKKDLDIRGHIDPIKVFHIIQLVLYHTRQVQNPLKRSTVFIQQAKLLQNC